MSMSTTAPEKYHKLPDGRTLAYSESGDASSTTLIIFFHGAFGVGNASNPPRVLVEGDFHFVAPTLPGWGKSSPRNKQIPYHLSFPADIASLIEQAHPLKEDTKIYLSGGSYGTVPAQVLYGAPFDVFPPGCHVAGCLILAPFSPFKLHKEYKNDMTLQNYLAVGPPSQYIPFNLIARLGSLALGHKFKTREQTEAFIRETFFNKMGDEERAAFTKWSQDNDRTEAQVERDLGDNMYRSVEETWDGFLEISNIIHGDWGFNPGSLDEDHAKRPIVIVASEGDTMAPDGMAKWLAATYKKAHFRSVSGGHLASLFHLNDLWKDLLAM
ncbi:unnamed protein product [Cyclocybe aegerita]|uniref:AB hydrolase-1 domain-containing protein n=1 Tax=Cyclocybe aegerita TaxID=1973307 RepID=A0A8S0XKM4_CYCAE|nr:unnamed protein product [Cyclocybe aegerita]